MQPDHFQRRETQFTRIKISKVGENTTLYQITPQQSLSFFKGKMLTFEISY